VITTAGSVVIGSFAVELVAKLALVLLVAVLRFVSRPLLQAQDENTMTVAATAANQEEIRNFIIDPFCGCNGWNA
jgi:hypothetical protein